MSRHTHDDPGQLTFGCPACIADVQRDQRLAAISDQPLRQLAVEWYASVRQAGTVVIEARYLDDENPITVADRCQAEIYDLIKDEPIFDNADVDWDIETAVFGATPKRRAS